MAIKYPYIIDGEDFRDMVECDSYETTVEIVYSDVVTTMDGVDHTEAIRKKGVVIASYNPQTAERTAKLCKALLNSPVEVRYHCLVRDVDVLATMIIDGVTARHLSRILLGKKKWNEIGTVTLREL